MNTNSISAPKLHENIQSTEELQSEIAILERKLQDAKSKLLRAQDGRTTNHETSLIPHAFPSNAPPHHYLLLLSDSALPLGSFAFSSGLESYLAHTPTHEKSFTHFLTLSLASYASTTLPFVLAAHRNPVELLTLDDGLDAAIMCTVGRRASVAQGRALLGVWERSLLPSLPKILRNDEGSASPFGVLKELSKLVRKPVDEDGIPFASAHLPPLFGAVSAVLGLSEEQTAYVYLLSHVKALLSAAVRASIFGPYQAQKVLAGIEVQEGIKREVERNWQRKWEEAGQEVPVLDLWVGRHEVLYSRIFNS